MKTCSIILSLLICAVTAFAAGADLPQEFDIVVSPFQPPADRARQQLMLEKFILSDASNGSRVIVWDGWALTVVCDEQLPRLPFDSINARAPRVTQAFTALGQWFANLDEQQSPVWLKGSSCVKIPEAFENATAQPAKGRRTIVFLGVSPFCLVPDELTFSMSEGRYPSDAHLNAGDKSIYSVVNKHERLAGVTVLWAYPSEGFWTSENHKRCVSRWWCLYVSSQEGKLATFNADTSHVLMAATQTDLQAIGEYAPNPADPLVMRTAGQREVPVKVEAHIMPPPEPIAPPMTKVDPITVPPPVKAVPPPASRLAEKSPGHECEVKSIAKPEESVAAAISLPPEIPKPAAGNVGIAAVWTARQGTDMDLWVAAKPGMPEAYWHRPLVERVHYFRDIRTSQSVMDSAQWRAAWEYVEVEGAQITEPTVWLNVYEASGPVQGIVRLQFNGHVVDIPFEFNVTRGNHGRDSSFPARLLSPYWQQINLPDSFKTASDYSQNR